MKTDRKPTLTIADVKGPDRRDVRQTEWPGLERQIGVLELRCSEIQSAYFAARERFAKAGLATIDPQALDAFGEELEIQCCFRMLVDPEAREAKWRLFKTADECRERLSPDERGYFYGLQAALHRERVASWAPAGPEDQGGEGEPEGGAEAP